MTMGQPSSAGELVRIADLDGTHRSGCTLEKGTDMTEIEINELYKTNDKFKEYADKYAKHHGLLPEYALKCVMVRIKAEEIRKES